jgi:nucleotide-binding universal stress UspA family protein
MIALRKILAATDFSEHSRVAVDYAAALAKTFGAEVLLCHVVEPPDLISQGPPTGEAYFPPNLSQLQHDAAESECARLLQEADVSKGRALVAIGSPFIELIRIARDENADLLIAGTHGRGAVAHMLLGSVAEKLVRKSPCPVLVVRAGEHDFVMP